MNGEWSSKIVFWPLADSDLFVAWFQGPESRLVLVGFLGLPVCVCVLQVPASATASLTRRVGISLLQARQAPRPGSQAGSLRLPVHTAS
jgi:hypothetical protein